MTHSSTRSGTSTLRRPVGATKGPWARQCAAKGPARRSVRSRSSCEYVGPVNSGNSSYDVVVVGGGHNGLVSAAYLARAGLSVARARAAGPHRRRGRLRRAVRRAPGPALALLLPRQPDAGAADGRPGPRRPARARAPRRRTRPGRAASRAGGLLVERPEGEATARVVPRADRRRRGVRRLAGVLRRGRPAGRGRGADAACSRSPSSATSAALVDERIWADVVERAARPRDPVALHRRHRPRRRRHRRADRHLRVDGRPLAGPEPLLPLPPDRQRHRRVAGAGRRHGRGHRRARAGRRRRPAPRSSPAPASARIDARSATAPRSPGTTATGEHSVAAPARAVRRRALGAADPARRGRGRRDQAGRLAAQDQLPARPAAAR